MAGLWSDADRNIAARVEIASLNGDPSAARNGSLGWLDPSEVWSLDEKKNRKQRGWLQNAYIQSFNGCNGKWPRTLKRFTQK